MSSDSTALTPEQMAATIADLEKQLGKGGKLSFEVSEKGAVSVYGLGRFPVTLCTALTPEQMAATIADLEKQLGKGGKLSFEVSEKGAVSVYGLGRFPVTLCYEQWNACSRMSNSCKCFLKKTDLDSIQLYCSTLVSL